MTHRPSPNDVRSRDSAPPRESPPGAGARRRRAKAARRAGVAVLLAAGSIVGLASCHAGGGGSSAPEQAGAPPDAGATGRETTGMGTGSAATPTLGSPPPEGPPAVERSCQRDEDCAVARVEVSGPQTCCLACGTTPGTRLWNWHLRQYCAAHPAQGCSPLACPEGPTVAVCRAGVCEATGTGPDGGAARVPVEQRCLPAMVCTTWKGCALVSGSAQDGWFVEQGEESLRGQLASVGNVCTVRERCEAASVLPPGVVCPPWSVPPLIDLPPYTCALEGGQCRSKAR